MNVLEFTAVVAIVSFVAGLLGSLTGLGGGVVLVPLLTIFFHVDIRYAIGASLVSVMAESPLFPRVPRLARRGRSPKARSGSDPTVEEGADTDETVLGRRGVIVQDMAKPGSVG